MTQTSKLHIKDSEAVVSVVSEELRADIVGLIRYYAHHNNKPLVRSLQKILAIAEAKPVVSAVSEDLREKINLAINAMYVDDSVSIAGINAIRELLAIADAQAADKDLLEGEVGSLQLWIEKLLAAQENGWVPGRPTDKGDYCYEDDKGDIRYARVRDVAHFYAMTANSCGCVQHFRIPERTPPTKTPAVECCDEKLPKQRTDVEYTDMLLAVLGGNRSLMKENEKLREQLGFYRGVPKLPKGE